MSELTRIITAQITCIENYENALPKEEAQKNIKEMFITLGADDALVTVQDFVMEKKGE